jgi:hypothetical protein
MIQTPKEQILLKYVRELINLDTMKCDEVVVKELFNPIDTMRILRIPLSENMTEDFISWHMTKSSKFFSEICILCSMEPSRWAQVRPGSRSELLLP